MQNDNFKKSKNKNYKQDQLPAAFLWHYNTQTAFDIQNTRYVRNVLFRKCEKVQQRFNCLLLNRFFSQNGSHFVFSPSLLLILFFNHNRTCSLYWNLLQLEWHLWWCTLMRNGIHKSRGKDCDCKWHVSLGRRVMKN